MTSVGEQLPIEMARVRDKVMPAYLAIGSSGVFALTMMRSALDRAAVALAESDVIECIRVLKELEEFKT